MRIRETAWFLYRPRRAEDLRRPHRLEEEREYRVIATVALSAIDYENFTEDMLADRVFLEQHAKDCKVGGPLPCVLVQTEDGTEGILVHPEGDLVKRAAYVTIERGE